MPTWVGQYEPLELFCLWTKVNIIFFAQRERVAVEEFFQMFDMSIRSRDIRDRSRKLSEIAPNLGRFFAIPNFRGPAFQKLYPFYHPYLTARRMEKLFCEDTPISPEVLFAHIR